MKFKELENYNELYNNEVFYNLIGRAMFMPTINKVKNAVESIYKKQQGYVFYCEKDDQIVGLVGLKRVDNDFEVMHLAVLESHESQGVGRFMITELEKYPGIKSIYLETDDEALNFYKSVGFTCKKQKNPTMDFARYDCRKKV